MVAVYPVSPINNQSLASNNQQSRQQQQQQQKSALTPNEIKAAKIREALEKMREADIKKIYVKFFIDDGTSTVSLLIDERWTVADVIKQIAKKLKISINEQHTIVEEYPELLIKRIYEDHEYLVENIMMWTLNSQNKLHFTRRLDKYAFISNPEQYLLTQKNLDTLSRGPPSPDTKRRVLEEFFDSDTVHVPEIDGWLLLKSDGKKSWKRHFFVLRSSGLYYCPKGKSRNSKDLQCLMNMQTNQVYTCTDWKRKYKAPSSFGFAIKHPKIQVKASKYIKYVCAEDALTFQKWMIALRIAKNGKQLYENYMSIRKYLEAEASAAGQAVKVAIPQVSPNFSMVSSSVADLHGRPQAAQQHPLPLLNLGGARSTSSRLSNSSSIGNEHQGCSSNPSSIVFDQFDDTMTGTIKRAPGDLLLGSSSHRSSLSECRSPSDGIASPGASATATTADSDSDEEQFPPPPPTVPAMNAHQCMGIGDRLLHEDATSLRGSPCATPVVTRAPFEPSTSSNGHIPHYAQINKQTLKPIAVPAVPPVVANRHQMTGAHDSHPLRPLIVSFQDSKPCGGSIAQQKQQQPPLRKMPPPPPPKRSDTTRLQTANVEALHSELEIAMARRLQKIGQQQ